MRRLSIFFIGLVVVLFTTSLVYAQNPARGPGNGSKRQRVHQLIMMRLSTGLNLTQAEAQQLSTVLNKQQQSKRQLRHQLRQLTAQLRTVTASNNQGEIQSTLKKLQTTRDRLDRVNEEMFSEVKTLLNPQQLAQFVLTMDEIRHEVRAVRRGVGVGRPGQQPPPYRPPAPGYTPGYGYPPAPQAPSNSIFVGP